MADELKLDIVVDEHGSAKKLDDVDAGVNKIVGSATQATPQVEKLSGSFLGMAGNAGKLAVGLGVAIPVLTFFSSQLRAAAEDARKFTDAAQDLESDAQRIQALTFAAAENRVSFDQMTGGLQRLQERIGSGKLNADLRALHINLESFRQSDIVDQFLEINDAIAAIESPLDRASMKARVFKGDAEELGRLAKAGFREAVDGAEMMSKDTIQALSDMEKAFDDTVARLKAKSKNLVAEGFIGFLNLMGRQGWQGPEKNNFMPEPPGRPGQPEALPTMGADPGWAARNIELLNEQLAAQKAVQENLYRIDEIFRQIDASQKLVVKSGGDWSEVLNTRVAAAVDNINAKFVNAVMLNERLKGSAVDERDRLMQQLTATTNPNESSFDKRFNEIDQEAKAKLAAVDQTDRVSAATAENAILEEMNLKVLELQTNWEKATQSVVGHQQAVTVAGQSYGGRAGSMGPSFGSQLPGGLVMPTADQVATGRYFGPVDANGRPDPARMGGAVPATFHTTINAQGSLMNTPDALADLASRLEVALSELGQSRGVKASR